VSGSFSYPKSYRLLFRTDFQKVAYRGFRHKGAYLAVEIMPNSFQITRLGISISKKFGNSPQRNHFKRLVREAFRLNRHRLLEGFDIVVKPRIPLIELTLEMVKKDLLGILTDPRSFDS
jgi:ribonuclease P protein component